MRAMINASRAAPWEPTVWGFVSVGVLSGGKIEAHRPIQSSGVLDAGMCLPRATDETAMVVLS
jgi:hypothetical protein